VIFLLSTKKKKLLGKSRYTVKSYECRKCGRKDKFLINNSISYWDKNDFIKIDFIKCKYCKWIWWIKKVEESREYFKKKAGKK